MRGAIARRSLWSGLLLFLLGGLVSARLDGIALVDLPFGPGVTGGPVLTTTAMLAPNVPRPAEDSGADVPDPLVIATEGDYPPFNYVDETGALRGLEIDYIYAVCTDLNVACRLVTRRWEALLPGLRAGDYHAVAASMRIADPAPDGIAFSDPYFATAGAFATRRGDGAGRRDGPVAVEAGTRMAAYLARTRPATGIRRYADPLAAYQALADGEVRAIFDDAVRLARWLDDPSAACCALAGPPVRDRATLGPGVGFAVRAQALPLRAALNRAIANLERSGIAAELTDRYLPIVLTGGT